MLIVSNGAFRSGSTWLTNVLRATIDHCDIPIKYNNTSEWKSGTSIHPKKLIDFLEEVDYESENYIPKNHLGSKYYRDVLLKYENVVVIDIVRDIKDTVTSGYYYYCRRGEFSGDFKEFYWERGRYIADHVRRYHVVWKVNSPNVYTSSYEKLVTDYASEVRSIGEFLGIELSDDIIEKSLKITNIKKLREKWNEGDKTENERFFRKGVVGDWKNHFSEEMLDDIEKIEGHGLGVFERYFYRMKIKSNSLVGRVYNK